MSSNLSSNVSYQTALRLRSVTGLQDALTQSKNKGASLWKKGYVLGPSYVIQESFVDNDSNDTTFSYGKQYKWTLPSSVDFALTTHLYLHIGRSYNTASDTYFTDATGNTAAAALPTGANRGTATHFSTDAMHNLFTDSSTTQFRSDDTDDAADRDISYVRCAEDFGRSLWEEANFTIAGNTTIQTVTSLWDHIEESLEADTNLTHAVISGRTGDGQGDHATLSAIPHFHQLFYVPLNFFYSEPQQWLNVLGLYLTTPKIEIKFRNQNELIFASDYAAEAIANNQLHADWTVAKVLAASNKQIMPILDARILIRHLLVDQSFRKSWGKKAQTFFIKEARDLQTTIAAGTSPAHYDIDLKEQHNMCSELVIVFRSDANMAAGHYYDFSGGENIDPDTTYDFPGVDSYEAFASLQPMLGTNAIQPELPATYWRVLMPSMTHQRIPSELIYCIPFYMTEQKDMSNYKGYTETLVKNSHNLSRLSNFKVRVFKANNNTSAWLDGTLHCFTIIRNVLQLRDGSITRRWGSS